MVKQILPTLLREGHLVRSALGVRIRDSRDLSDEDRAHLKLGADDKGAVIEGVEPSGPAAAAKLEVGDLITAFDGQVTDRSSLLQWKASTAGVGKTVALRVVRLGKTFDVNVTLGTLKEGKRPSSLRYFPPPPDPGDER
jgi:S1-C subfamily serine protease